MVVAYVNSTKEIITALNRRAEFQDSAGTSLDPPFWPVLAEQALHGLAGEFVQSVTANSEADPVGLLISFLTCIAGSLGEGPALRLGYNRYPMKLFSVLAGSTRSRKQTALEHTREILAAARQHHPHWQKWKELVFSFGSISTGEDIIEALVTQNGIDFIPTPSSEEDNDQHCQRVLLVADDFESTLRAMQRSNATLGRMLSAIWESSEVTLLGSRRKKITKRAHVCLLGHTSLAELQELMSAESRWNALASRVLWVVVRRTQVVPCPSAMDKILSERLAEKLVSALAFAAGVHDLYLSPESEPLWVELYNQLSQEEVGAYGAVTARAEAHVLRLAGIFALLDKSTAVLPCHLEAAMAVWNYCKSSARLIFGCSRTSSLASRILSAVSERPKTLSELHRVFGRHVKGSDLNYALTELQARRLVAPVKSGGGPSNGRPTTTWCVTQDLEPTK